MTKADRPGRSLGWLAAPLLAVLFGIATEAAADEKPVKVVELFTSQGCSSCPPANANLEVLSERPDVLALSFGVTYWDRLGWKDTFAHPDYTNRQVAYEAPLGQAGPFTPQVVVNGRATLVGNDLAAIGRLLSEVAAPAAASITIAARDVKIGPGKAPQGGADIWQVQFDPKRVEVVARRGENRGRTLPHKNVVHDLKHLGTWTGQAIAVPRQPALYGLRTAVLLQSKEGGPILAAGSE